MYGYQFSMRQSTILVLPNYLLLQQVLPEVLDVVLDVITRQAS